MMVIVVPMYVLPDPPCPAVDPVGGEILSPAPCFEVFLPPVPEAGKIGLDHVEQCHITGRAHETSDPIQPVFVEPVVGRMLHKKVEPDVKRSPVLDRGGGKLHLYRRVSPHAIALCPREGFVPALADKREALPPGRADRLCDRQELADAAAPAGVDGRRALPGKGCPEFFRCGSPDDLCLVLLLHLCHIRIGLRELEAGVGKEPRNVPECLAYDQQGSKAVFSPGVRDSWLERVRGGDVLYKPYCLTFELCDDPGIGPDGILPCGVPGHDG